MHALEPYGAIGHERPSIVAYLIPWYLAFVGRCTKELSALVILLDMLVEGFHDAMIHSLFCFIKGIH